MPPFFLPIRYSMTTMTSAVIKLIACRGEFGMNLLQETREALAEILVFEDEIIKQLEEVENGMKKTVEF